MQSPRFVTRIALAAFVLMPALPAANGDLAIDDSGRGWFRDDGTHFAGHLNVFTGTNEYGDYEYHSFFTFDLAGVAQPVSSARLHLELQDYLSADSTEPFTVYDVAASGAELLARHTGTPAGRAIYEDLGSGSVYGAAIASAAQVGSFIDITLSAQAISDINASLGGLFSVGFRSDSPRDTLEFDEGFRFAFSTENRTHQLIIESVPAPGAALLAFGGLPFVVALRRKLA